MLFKKKKKDENNGYSFKPRDYDTGKACKAYL